MVKKNTHIGKKKKKSREIKKRNEKKTIRVGARYPFVVAEISNSLTRAKTNCYHAADAYVQGDDFLHRNTIYLFLRIVHSVMRFNGFLCCRKSLQSARGFSTFNCRTEVLVEHTKGTREQSKNSFKTRRDLLD